MSRQVRAWPFGSDGSSPYTRAARAGYSGEVVGEMALVDDAPRSADVVAQDGAVTVFALSREVFRRLLDEGTPGGAPLLGGIVVALVRRFEESIRKAATFRVLSGPF